jgi:hypothetical protein
MLNKGNYMKTPPVPQTVEEKPLEEKPAQEKPVSVEVLPEL